MDEKSKSNHYNPFVYVKELPTFDEVLGIENTNHSIQEDDVMTLINTFMANTKVEEIESTSGDPFWNRAEMI